MNKKKIHIYFFIYTYTHLCFFYFFYFLLFTFLFFGLGPAQPIWAGLDPASPARSLAQASDPAGQKKDARVKQLHACMNSAKVIKLPSHNTLATLEFQRM